MIRLSATTQKLQAVLAGAITTTNPDVVCSWSDATSSNYLGGQSLIAMNGSTAVDIVAAPAASTVRDIDSVTIRNNDTVSVTCTVRYNDNATLYKLITVTLRTGETLQYTHASGWQTLDVNGNIKQAVGPVPSSSLIGTTTNDDAAAGVVGEYIESTVTGSSSGVTSGVAKNVTSISLSAGDWDVSGNVHFQNSGPVTTATYAACSISTTSATHGNQSTDASWVNLPPGIDIPVNPAFPTPLVRLSLAATTTVYLVGTIAFTPVGATTFGVNGILRATRRR